jgi:hypothetical protein
MESCGFGLGFPFLKKGAAWGASRLFSSGGNLGEKSDS